MRMPEDPYAWLGGAPPAGESEVNPFAPAWGPGDRSRQALAQLLYGVSDPDRVQALGPYGAGDLRSSTPPGDYRLAFEQQSPALAEGLAQGDPHAAMIVLKQYFNRRAQLPQGLLDAYPVLARKIRASLHPGMAGE